LSSKNNGYEKSTLKVENYIKAQLARFIKK